MGTAENGIPAPPPLPPTMNYHRFGNEGSTTAARAIWERLFDEAYRADVIVHSDCGDKIYAHASILGVGSRVMKNMLKQSKRGKHGRRSLHIRGVSHDAVRFFIRFLYSSSYDSGEMEELVVQLLVLSHAFAVPDLKRECEGRLEKGMLNTENVVDIFQLAMLCDASRLSLVCHRLILRNLKPVQESDGWKAMKQAHPTLEKQILRSVTQAEMMQKVMIRRRKERKMYAQLYEAMEALVHICRDGCKTIGPHDKALKEDEGPCKFAACKGLELLVRHFAGCKLRVPGGCHQCKRMWQLFGLHSRLCAAEDSCKVPLCWTFKERSRKQNNKEGIKWRILARKIVRSKSITGAPCFSLVAGFD